MRIIHLSHKLGTLQTTWTKMYVRHAPLRLLLDPYCQRCWQASRKSLTVPPNACIIRSSAQSKAIPSQNSSRIRRSGHFETTAKHLKNGNQFFINLMDWYYHFTCSVPVSKTGASHTPLAFIENLIMLYGISNILLMETWSQFVSRLFKALCSLLCVEKLMVTARHPETNCQAKRYIKTPVKWLQQLLIQHQFMAFFSSSGLHIRIVDKCVYLQAWLVLAYR